MICKSHHNDTGFENRKESWVEEAEVWHCEKLGEAIGEGAVLVATEG